MKISLRQRIICGLTAFAFTLTVLTPSVWVFAEDAADEITGITAEEVAVADAPEGDTPAEESGDTSEETGDTVTVSDMPTVPVSDTGTELVSYDTYLGIAPVDGELVDGMISNTTVSSAESTEILTAAGFEQSELGAQRLSITIKELPETENGEIIALYGIKDGTLSDEALLVSPEIGASAEMDITEWSGAALVKILPSEQELSFTGEDEGTNVSISGILPDGAEITAEPVEAGEVREIIENEDTAPIADVVFAYDISINSAAGEFQPAEGESVDVVLSSPAIAEAAARGGRLTVVHIADDGTVTDIICDVSEDGTVSFSADGFSVYAVVEHTIEGTLSVADKTYKITVEYGDEAGIPAGATLRVWWADPEEYLPGTMEVLGWTDDDMVYYSKFFDLAIMFDGVETEPKAPVFVTAELLDVEEGAKALKVVHFTDDGAEEIRGNVSDNAVITFETDSFSVYGFGSAMHALASEKTDSLEFAVYSFDETAADSALAQIEVPEEGFETLRTVTFADRGDSELWVRATLPEGAQLPEGESIGVYAIKDNAACDVMIGDIAADSELRPIDSNTEGVALIKDTGYRHLNLKAFPDEASIIALDGMMPKESEITADDVTDQYAVTEEGETTTLAAYDITINAPRGEYQPTEERPISVEITDPRINTDGNIELYHITDDGVTEQVTDFTLSQGKISFAAVGFSVYKIVNAKGPYNIDSGFFNKIAEDGPNGLDVCLYVGKNSPAITGTKYYFTNNLVHNVTGNSDRDGIMSTETAPGEKLYFIREEDSVNNFYIYLLINGENKYLKMTDVSGNNARGGLTLVDENNKGLFTLTNDIQNGCVTVSSKSDSGKTYYLNRNTKTDQYGAIAAYNTNSDNNCIWFSFDFETDIPDDYYELDGKTYGLVNYFSDSNALGYAFMNSPNYCLETLVKTDPVNNNEATFVAKDSNISMWTFHSISQDKYRISTDIGGETKYLKITDTGLTIVSDITESSLIQVIPGTGTYAGKIRLVDEQSFRAVKRDGTKFTSASDSSNKEFWFDLVELSGLLDEDYVTYSANKVSVSAKDVKNGDQVIVYTRVWHVDHYDFYAVDHDGSLVRCYDDGDTIGWLGNRVNTLLWDFTEYYNEDGSPNYYYELQNRYSKKYLAPQKNSVLSDNTVGINMQGRKENAHYTTILAWDDPNFAYWSLDIDPDTKELKSGPLSKADTFYFAKMTKSSDEEQLTTVTTVDNNEYGITMKMVDFGDNSKNIAAGSYITSTYFGGDCDNTRGLLSTDLKKNESTGEWTDPTVALATGNVDADFGQAFAGAIPVNHLFIKSTHDESGYFEFDSCQNFATLIQPNGLPGTDFIVYDALATDNKNEISHKHGQFYPYNTIKSGVYSGTNPYNLYDALKIELDDNDPGKYEKLYLLQKSAAYGSDKYNSDGVNCYNGMVMEASFAKTPDGLDAWGHDVIFEFTGDDDFWLYVDGELVLDLGGVHSAISGKVNFRTGSVVYDLGKEHGNGSNVRNITLLEIYRENFKARTGITDNNDQRVIDYLKNYFIQNADGTFETVFKNYSTHHMKVYYMERGAGASNLHMRFNLSSVKPGQVMLSKEISGSDELDYDLVEFPFQIKYKPKGIHNYQTDAEGYKTLEEMNGSEYNVYYSDSPSKVKYKPSATINGKTYNDVFYLHPGQSVYIAFPDELIDYKIVECGINHGIYDEVYANDVEIKNEGNTNIYQDFATPAATVAERTQVVFNNHVDEDALRDLTITKVLYDENYDPDNENLHKLTYKRSDESSFDPAVNDDSVFTYRLSLYNGILGDYEPASIIKYYVLDPDDYYCYWDSATQSFVPTTTKRTIIDENTQTTIPDSLKESITLYTSINGTMSKIPAGYSVVVPGLIVGTQFRVEEREFDNPVGYQLIGYERVEGYNYVDGKGVNYGEIKESSYAAMNVKNKRGFGLEATKIWTDKSITSSHDPIYTAVYVNGVLKRDTVRAVVYPNIKVRYFFDKLADGTTLNDYEIREVKVIGGTVDETKHLVTDFTGATIEPVLDNGLISIYATDKNGARDQKNYNVTYSVGEITGCTTNARKDDIINTRGGGIQIRLGAWRKDQYCWGDSSRRLEGGVFTLKSTALSDEDNKKKYVADQYGTVLTLYEFTLGEEYFLTELETPPGYIYGDHSKLKFIITEKTDKTGYDFSLYFQEEDGTWILYNPEDPERGFEWYHKDANGDECIGCDWANYEMVAGESTDNLIAYVNIYNRPYELTVKKTDGATGEGLKGVHFALYRQVEGTGGLMKDYYPMTGFEDLVSVDDGVIPGLEKGDIPGLDENLPHGTYYLVETQALPGYDKFDKDIMLIVDYNGIRADYGNVDKEEEDDTVKYIYTISLPNTKGYMPLTINKVVSGNMGNKAKEFTFTFTVGDGNDTTTEYQLVKNSETPVMKHSGDTFTMAHGDTVTILVPVGKVTITETNDNYDTVFVQGDDTFTSASHEFNVTGATTVTVTNSLNGIVPTGVRTDLVQVTVMAVSLLAGAAMLVRRRYTLPDTDDEDEE